MDLSGLKTAAIPVWLKVLIGLLVACALGADAWIGLTAFQDAARRDWFSVAVQLFGTLLPIALIGLLLALSKTGTSTLQRRTSELLLETIPSLISYAATPVPAFEGLRQARRRRRFVSTTLVQVAYHPGDFYARYRIEFPNVWSDKGERRVCFLIVDLKIHDTNLHLCVPRAALDAYCREHGFQGAQARWLGFQQAFHHTLSGARGAGCDVNESVVDVELAGQPLTAAIVVRRLATDFLHEPAEQLYVAQDLAAMLRGFWRERTSWFPEAAG